MFTVQRRIAPLSLAITAALATLSTSIHANQAPDNDMEKIVVTASGYEQLIKNAPASISVIDREELSQRFYRDLTDAMTDVPGVVVTGGGDREDISLRGMGSQYTLILVDGKRQSSRELARIAMARGLKAPGHRHWPPLSVSKWYAGPCHLCMAPMPSVG